MTYKDDALKFAEYRIEALQKEIEFLKAQLEILNNQLNQK
jgi:uncharacterized small protein (DUF1192 family)